MRRAAAPRLSAVILAAALVSLPAVAGDAGKCQSDAMIVFDASGSMGATDYAVKLPRIARVKNSMAKVIPEVAPCAA